MGLPGAGGRRDDQIDSCSRQGILMAQYTVRQRLRDATAPVHEAMHSNRSFASLIEGKLTIHEYRTLLARLYGFHFALERQLCAVPPSVLGDINVRGRERSAGLKADLSFLGMRPQEIDQLPLCDTRALLESHVELLGCLYVIEGSGLGGKVLARKLDSLLGEKTTEGRQFFSGRPAPDRLSWPELCGLLEGQAEHGDIGLMVASAERTFLALANWLGEDEIDG